MTGPIIAFLLSAAAAPTAYTGFEPLTSASADAPLCTADASICIATSEPDALTVTRGGKEIAHWSPDMEGGDLTIAPLPALIRLKGNRLLVGILATRQTSYSGGGGSATEQRLALVEPGKEAQLVLMVPESGNLMIRACFSEKDYKQRAGACHDEYRFGGELAVAASAGGEPPMLSFRMTASNYPSGVSRDKDSLAGPRLRKADLVWQDDADCNYRRLFHFDGASGRYVPDAELPDCSDYTQP